MSVPVAKRRLPFGFWPSPLSPERVAEGSIRPLSATLSGGIPYVTESRPAEKGRVTLIAYDPTPRECLPAGFSIRSRVHEYGGGALAIADNVAYFVNDGDQKIYRLELATGAAPTLLSCDPHTRHADLCVDRRRKSIVCVTEKHLAGRMPKNQLQRISQDQGESRVLASGADFYASPRLSPDGNRLAFLAWNHPNMPWDGCTLHLGRLDEAGVLTEVTVVAGGPEEWIAEPSFSPDGTLYFVSDRDGHSNLYRLLPSGQTENLTPVPADFCTPPWIFGLSNYAFLDAQTLLCAFVAKGVGSLALLDLKGLHPIPTPLSDFSHLVAEEGQVVFLAGSPTARPALFAYDRRSGIVNYHDERRDSGIPHDFLSVPRPLEFPTTDRQVAHGFFYPPHHPEFQGVEGERPPLIVVCHGGPTGAASTVQNPAYQFWTSRGFAVLDVNYRGSTGFGRAYRHALDGKWGLADVEDCVAGAQFLAETGQVDPNRRVIRGSSAGGLTVLSALAFHRVFAAGASYYGVGDLESLAKDTHKFESRYLDRLVGPFPEQKARYQARSPLYHAEKIQSPVIFFHGLEDPVVPPEQAQRMSKALQDRGLPAPLITFPSESHGFRRSETIATALAAELDFYQRLFEGRAGP